MLSKNLEFREVLYDGAVIAGILFFWGGFALLGVGVRNVGGPGSYLIPLGEALISLFMVVGLGNALLYIIARALSLSDS